MLERVTGARLPAFVDADRDLLVVRELGGAVDIIAIDGANIARALHTLGLLDARAEIDRERTSKRIPVLVIVDGYARVSSLRVAVAGAA